MIVTKKRQEAIMTQEQFDAVIDEATNAKNGEGGAGSGM
jgi:hypothetical protein